MKIIFPILLLSLISCKNQLDQVSNKSDKEAIVLIEQTVADTIINPADYNFQKDNIFSEIANYPNIADSNKFKSELIFKFDLEIDNDDPVGTGNITKFQKFNIYGSEKSFFLVEYDWKQGCMAAYPWKSQFIFNESGHLIKQLFCARFESLQVFKGQHPCLLTLFETARGNGGHQLYKITNDTLENIYEGYYDCEIKTFDSNADEFAYQPNELNVKVVDNNNDGFNDIMFFGTMVLTMGLSKTGNWYNVEINNGDTIYYSYENPYKELKIILIFEYDKITGHFKAKEDYVKKYWLDQ